MSFRAKSRRAKTAASTSIDRDGACGIRRMRKKERETKQKRMDNKKDKHELYGTSAISGIDICVIWRSLRTDARVARWIKI